MEYIIFNGEISEENLEIFVDNINKTKDDITLYITTYGGTPVIGDIIIDIINNEDKIKKVIFSWNNSSMGFDILMETQKPKKMMDGISLIHISSRDLDFRDYLNKDKSQSFLLDNLKSANIKLLEKYREYGLSEEQLTQIENGEDIWLEQKEIENLKGWNNNEGKYSLII